MNTLRQQSLDRRHVAALRRWRWLVLLTGLLSVFTIELLEHESITDPHFWREFALYGLVVPILVWLFLTMLANQADGRSEAEARSDWQQELNRSLEEHQEWPELTRFIVGFPATFLPVDHVSLFVYDHMAAQLRFVTEWNAFGLIDSPLRRYQINYSVCRSCFTSKSSAIHPLDQCGFVSATHPPSDTKEYCQTLLCNGLLVGVQLLRCKPGKDLNAQQQDLLKTSAASIVLALVLAIARRTQIDQTRNQAESAERQRVAAELHDSLGQMISYLHFNLDRLANDGRLQAFDDIQQQLVRMRQVADSAYDQIRSDLWVTHTWKTSNVVKAIAEHVESTAYSSGLDIQLRNEGEQVLLEPKVSYQVFAIVCEGLNNIVTHAQARHADIALIWAIKCLQIHLADDGIGFDPTRASHPGHYGLRIMSERVLALDGTMLIDSSPGRGARLSFTLPLERSATVPNVVNVADLPTLGRSIFTESPDPIPKAETPPGD